MKEKLFIVEGIRKKMKEGANVTQAVKCFQIHRKQYYEWNEN